jgi:3-methyladenine DNA glycosylase AlkD
MRSKIEERRVALVQELHKHRKPAGDFPLQSYLGSPYPVLSLSTPTMRRISSDFVKAHSDLSISHVNNLANSLWKGRTFEEKILAISILNRFHRILDAHTWRMMDMWIEQAKGWALCDALGSGPISTMLHKDRNKIRDVLKWTRAKSFWRRRISTYALRDLIYGKDLKQPFVVLEKLLYDEEFWVQRSVGTWLRECWKRDRKRTESFLLKHGKGMPRVTITVVTERAPKAFREKLRSMR